MSDLELPASLYALWDRPSFFVACWYGRFRPRNFMKKAGIKPCFDPAACFHLLFRVCQHVPGEVDRPQKAMAYPTLEVRTDE